MYICMYADSKINYYSFKPERKRNHNHFNILVRTKCILCRRKKRVLVYSKVEIP